MADRPEDQEQTVHPDAVRLSRRALLGSAAAGAGIAAFGVGHTASAGPATSSGAGPLRIADVTTEYTVNPLGTDVTRPRLAWIPTTHGHGAVQTAYQIVVATDPGLLDPRHADVWDSGRVDSAESTGIEYAGPPLAPRTRYHWRVRLWDGGGRGTRWRGPGVVRAGPGRRGLGAAQWVGAR